jgi:two-component system response regulator DevR
MKFTRILLVDDHEVVRMGLRALLDKQGAMQVVGEASSSAEAVEKAMALRPDVVLMDVRLPDESGVEACRRIRELDENIKVVMLTSYTDDEALFASVMAGASAYLLKRIDTDNLYQTVMAASRGESVLDPSISNKVVRRIKEISDGAPSRGIDLLTEREREILALIADGLTNKAIAEQVCLSAKTVRNYVSSILRKLGFTSRTQAAIYFMERKSPEEDPDFPDDGLGQSHTKEEFSGNNSH